MQRRDRPLAEAYRRPDRHPPAVAVTHRAQRDQRRGRVTRQHHHARDRPDTADQSLLDDFTQCDPSQRTAVAGAADPQERGVPVHPDQLRVPAVRPQVRADLLQRAQRLGHRRGLEDPVHGEEQAHHGIVRELEQQLPAAGILAQPADDRVDPAAVQSLDGVPQLLGPPPGRRLQLPDAGRRLVEGL